MVSIYAAWVAARVAAPHQALTRASSSSRRVWQAKWELTIPLIILLAIVTGWTLLESAALA